MKYSVELEDYSQGNDPVTRQYESLPYPPVEDNELKNEEQSYKTNDYPVAFFRSNVLESINHYLHRGKQNFR